MNLYNTTPERWYKLQRAEAQTEAEMDKITRIYEAWKHTELMIKTPFTIRLLHGQVISQKVWFTGYKTDGKNLFVEYQITTNGPKLVQEIV